MTGGKDSEIATSFQRWKDSLWQRDEILRPDYIEAQNDSGLRIGTRNNNELK